MPSRPPSGADGARLGFRHLVVELTRACNHACAHCYDPWRTAAQPGSAPAELTRVEVRELVARVRRDTRLEHVALSGGEPSLRGDLPGIVADLDRAGLGAVVITNGSGLASAPLGRFPRGTVFEVTLFSADARLHDALAGGPSFQGLLEGLARLERFRHHLAVTVVVTRANAHDVGRTIRLALAVGAGGVLLNRVNLTRHTLRRAPALVPPVEVLREALRQADEVAGRYRTGVAVSVPIQPCLAEPSRYPNLEFCWCPRGGVEAYHTVDPQGRLRPCNHSSRVLGDLRRRDFAELVARPKARSLWAARPAACRRCPHPLAARCGGGCPAAADECHGSPRRLDPFVELALGPSVPTPPAPPPPPGRRA